VEIHAALGRFAIEVVRSKWNWNSKEPGIQIGCFGGNTMTETMWRCDQVRAGQLYNRMMFDTREEAEKFMNRMRQMEPDQTISIEAIEARQVWN
jgi:hypothetical protein